MVVKEEKEQLDIIVKKMEEKFRKASQLIVGLQGESERWHKGI